MADTTELLKRLEAGENIGCYKCRHWRREGRSGNGTCLGPFWTGDGYSVPDIEAPELSWWEDRCDMFSDLPALLKAEG